MNKRLLVMAGAIAAVCLAGTAGATNTRIKSMGGAGHYKNITILDDNNIFVLPAELVKWGTWTAIEIGSYDHEGGTDSFGIHYNFSPTAVLALYGFNNTRKSVDLAVDSYYAPGYGASQVNQSDPAANNSEFRLGTLFGVDLGSTRLGFLLGLYTDRVSTFDKAGGETNNNGGLIIDFGIGAGFALGAADLDLGLLISYGSPTDFDEGADGGDTTSTNSEFDLGLVARLTAPFSGPHELVPYLRLDLAFGSGQPTGGDSYSGTEFGIALGLDIRLNLGEGITVQPGAGLAFGLTNVDVTREANGQIDSWKESGIIIPFYNVSVDVQVWEWLDIRFGGGHKVLIESHEEFKDQASEGGGGSTDQKWTLMTGVGFNLPSGVSIDIQVNTSWWKQGPYLITGNSGEFGSSVAISKDW